MSAPRKIWTDHGSDEWTYGAANAYDSPYEPSLHLYHHDDVVRELVEALEDIARQEPSDEQDSDADIEAGYDGCIYRARAALAKIAQENIP